MTALRRTWTAEGHIPFLGRARGSWILPLMPLSMLFAYGFVVPTSIVLSYAFVDGGRAWFDLLESPGRVAAVLRTVEIALQVTAICLLLSYAYVGALLHVNQRLRTFLLLATLVPFLTSLLVRTYAWIIVLGNDGPFNRLVRLAFGADAAVPLLYNRTGVMIGMIHVLLPLSILPLYAVMSQIPTSLSRAARSLGANKVEASLSVELPLSLPGAAAAATAVFISALGFFVTPSLLGGLNDTMVAQMIDRDMVRFASLSQAAVLAVVLTFTVCATLGLFRLAYPLELLLLQQDLFGLPGAKPPIVRRGSSHLVEITDRLRVLRLRLTQLLSRVSWKAVSTTVAVLIAVYFLLPLMVVVPVSLTGESYLHFPPDTLSLRWYEAVAADPLWRTALLDSLVVGVLASLVAFVVGLPLAFTMVRSRLPQAFKGTMMLIVLLPAVIPVIVLAVGIYVWYLRLRLVGQLWPLAIAHALIGLPYLTVVVMAGLRDFDLRLEQAARSLGAGAATTLRLITFPILRSSLLAGLLFAFLQSFDELLIARAVTNLSTITLPVKLWNGANEELSPALAVISVLSLFITLLAMGVLLRIRRSPKETQR